MRAETVSIEGTLAFSHQLFENSPALRPGRPVFFLREGSSPSRAAAYRKACQAAWTSGMERRGFRVTAVEPGPAGMEGPLWTALAGTGVGTLHAADPGDAALESRLRAFCGTNGIALVLHETPCFLLDRAWGEDFFSGRKHYRMAEFYRAVRRETGLLLDARGKPLGGKWSFDPENRRRLPKGTTVPPAWGGMAGEPIRLPVTRQEARAALEDFLETRVDRFGDYEDAMAESQAILFHSLLSPALNVGLLTPREVLAALMDRHAEKPVPLNSLEGFTRQVAGWREFMRTMYRLVGPHQRQSNALSHRAGLPRGFLSGKTGVPPVDSVVARVNLHGYAHHIERLMVLGNFLLLCETDPRAVTGWFMGAFADATDWAMVPNVHGMSQFADGGLMTTKPYCSGSAYLLRMGDFPKGPWCGDWDALFWRFVGRHRELFAGNPRTSVIARQLDRISPVRREEMEARAADVLSKLHE